MTFLKKSACIAAAHLMIFIPAGSAAALTQDHIVGSAELHHSLLEASRARQADLEKVRSFFSADLGKRALDHSGIGSARVVHALSSLDDEELARLAARVDRVNKDFAAGALSNQQLTYIVIALATAVVILVIIEA